MKPYCYLNGKILPLADAHVGLYDIGLLRGFGIYEGLITHNRKPFMVDEHLKRLRVSAENMRLTVPASDVEIAEAMKELVEHNVSADKEALFRVILTGGNAIEGMEYNQDTPTFYILAEEFTPVTEVYLENGCAVGIFEHQRKFPETKTINYIQAVLLQQTKKEQGVMEIIYVSNGVVLEATGSNLFIVKNRVLITPKAGILLGVTRQVVLRLAKQRYAIEERDISLEEVYAADECFITGSFKEVVPVVKVGDTQISDGKVGEVTKDIVKSFHEFTQNY